MSNKSLSLKGKILALTITVLTITCLIAVGLIEWSTHDRTENTKVMFDSYHTSLQEAIAAQFFERYGDIQAYARNSAFQEQDTGKMTRALNEYIHLYQIYDLIFFVSPEGRLIASNNLSPSGRPLDIAPLQKRNFSGEQWFRATLAEQYTESPSKGFAGTYVSDVGIDPYASEIYGENKWCNAFTSTVKNEDGEILGVLTARANFVWVENEFIISYHGIEKNGYPSSEYTLLDKKGNVIIDFDPSIQGNSNQVPHDFENVLGKLNLATSGVEAARKALSGEFGHLESEHARKGITQLASFGPVSSSKFLDDLGWNLLIRVPTSELNAAGNRIRIFALSTIGVIFILFLLLANWMGIGLAKNLINQNQLLVQNSQKAKQSSEQLGEVAQSLSESSSEQASAIQETMAAMEEMNSMISQTSRHASESAQLASSANDKTSSGRNIMSKMNQSMTTMQESNEKLNGILQIIEEISNKTNVINDIVFKTQLLSFNASIEAARAGQHGRGFAVVAEEVGSLAQVSGKSAQEIRALLTQSKQDVERIVQETKGRIDEGTQVSNEALQSFDEIAETINIISQKVSDINQASAQQESGINQTSTAISQLDISAQRNQESAGQTASLAKGLTHQSERLSDVVLTLTRVITGKSEMEEIRDSDLNQDQDLHTSPKKPATQKQTMVKSSYNQDWKPAEANKRHDENKLSADHPSFKKMDG